MHEYSIVESVLAGLLERLRKMRVARVAKIRFRRGSAFSEEALLQSYRALAAGTPLEGSEVSIETVNLNFECACGRKQVIRSDDLAGHMFVCPQCGAVKEVDEAHDLELVEVVAEMAGSGEEVWP